jgi:hypothetical protein
MRSKQFGLSLAWLAGGALAVAHAATPAPSPTATPTHAPAPAVSRSDAAPADGKALFAKVVENLGGKEKIGKVRDVWTRGQITAKAPQGDMTMEMETTMVFPDRLAQQVDAPFGRFAMVATPSGAFIQGDQGVQDLPAPMRDELIRQVQRAAFYLAQKIDDPKLVLRVAGEETIGDVQTRILDVLHADVSVRWFVDPSTGRILRSSHDSTGLDGKAVRVVSDYSDFRTESGFPLPHRLAVATDGSPDQTFVLEEVKINAGADAKLFEKPAAPTPRPTVKPKAKSD